ncbi:Holliday junction resolvase RusA (prophage-encoded endonuclease) [Geopseudomonas sagittaria]|uniref:Holliday junction resolvase RusA (Prophage-encoded endonuclease) n=1 Tax=Geopseudomonas sagittaria TaxID=1135990 RepID=A0A1I5PZS2_9GAMM|nr:RusA family crossover junction endodeoxyribonuclease [Pseudomonas sagittaria]SFP39201.1 Holliday junction resolvase RusA (prophage-encoded endonuclease) [Pseudomonas sagittaria]
MADFRPIVFAVPGEPQGKGRPRIGRVGQHARMFTPAKTVAYEGLVALAAQEAMQGRDMITGPVLIELHILHGVPQSMSKKRKAQALAGELLPMKKPDTDNVLKAICDGCNGVVWKDDVQATDGVFRRRYSETPGVRVRIVPLMEGE